MNNDSAGQEKQKFKYFGTVGRIAGILFIGFSLFLFMATIILIFLTKPDKEIQVPNIEGKRFLDVYNRLLRRGFKPEIKFKNLYVILESECIICGYAAAVAVTAVSVKKVKEQLSTRLIPFLGNIRPL